MKNLSTLIKFLTVLVIGGGTIGASVAMSSAKDSGNMFQVEAATNTLIDSSEQVANEDTTRILVHNGDAGNWTSSSALTAIRTWDNYNNSAIYLTSWVFNGLDKDNHDREVWIGYADIPIDIAGMQLVRLDPNNNLNIWNYGPDIDISNQFYSSKIYSLYQYNWTWSYKEFTVDEVSLDLAKVILGGYLTCSPSNLNGFGAFDELNNRYFSKISEEVKNCSLELDFSYQEYLENNKDYNGLEKVSTTETIGNKIAMMASLYGNANQSKIVNLNVDNYYLTLTITGLLSISIFCLISFVLFKRKSHI